LVFVGVAPGIFAQDPKVEPTWLHRYVPTLKETTSELSSVTCHYKPIFGQGDTERRLPKTVTRFAVATVTANGACPTVHNDREEAIYFMLKGSGVLRSGEATFPIRANDFTYLAPGTKHSIANNSQDEVQVLVIGLKILPGMAIAAPASPPKVVSLDDLKEETVEGHPTSVVSPLQAVGWSAHREARRHQ